MSYSKDREEFVYRMASHGWSLAAIRSVLKQAGILQRGAEVECSVQMTAEEAGALEFKMAAARKVIGRNATYYQMRATCAGDPRGYVVHLFTKDQNIESETGIPVPASGYSASQMARMTGRA